MHTLVEQSEIQSLSKTGTVETEPCSYTLHVDNGRTVITVTSSKGKKRLFGNSIPPVIKVFGAKKLEEFLSVETPWLKKVTVSDYEKQWLEEERPHELEYAELSKKLIWGCSPVLEHVFPDNAFEDWFYSAVPEHLHLIYKARNTKELVSNIFGQPRRDLERGVLSSNWNNVIWATKFAGTMPLDWIAEFLTSFTETVSSTITECPMEYEPIYIKSLRKLRPQQVRNLLHDAKTAGQVTKQERTQYEIALTKLANVTNAGIEKIRTQTITGWKSLIKSLDKIPAELLKEAHDFPKREIVDKIAATTLRGYSVTWLNNTRKLQVVSKSMENCCSELRYVFGGHEATDYLFLFKNKDSRYLMHVTLDPGSNKWSIVELKGHKNKNPSKPVHDYLTEYMSGIIKTELVKET